MPVLDDVGVRVRGDQRAVGADEAGEQRALVAVLGDARDAAQQQRVVRDEQVGADVDGLVDGGGDGVDGEQHAFDRRRPDRP